MSLIVCPGLVAALAAASCAPPAREVPELPEVKELRDNCRVSPGLVHAAVWVCARNLSDVTVFVAVSLSVAPRLYVGSQRISDAVDAFFRKKTYLCTYLI